jgi:choline monooxygenase
VGHLPVVLTHKLEGEIGAFYNVCPHRAGAVADGCGNRKSLTCSYHGWNFGLDGALRKTPDFEGVADFDPARFGLRPLRAATWGPLVLVNPSPAGWSLEQVMGAIPERTSGLELDRMSIIERREYRIRCNWKVFVENYLEGYHIPIVHPGLYRELDFPRYRVETFALYSEQHSPLRADGGTVYDARKGRDRIYYFWCFPNWMLNIYPDHLQLNVVVPVSPTETMVVFEWYVVDGTQPRSAYAAFLDFGDEVQREDIAICENVQRGLESGGYERGRLCPRHENGVHHFQGLVTRFLERDDPYGEG